MLVLRLAPFIPFFVVSIAPALFNVRLKTYRRRDPDRHRAGRLRFAWLGQGLDSVLEAARAARRPSPFPTSLPPR